MRAITVVAVVLAAATARSTEDRVGTSDNPIKRITYSTKASGDGTETTICLTDPIPDNPKGGVRLVAGPGDEFNLEGTVVENEKACALFKEVAMPNADGVVNYIVGYTEEDGSESDAVIARATFNFEKAGGTFQCGTEPVEVTVGGSDCYNDPVGNDGLCYKKGPTLDSSGCKDDEEIKYCQPKPQDIAAGTIKVASLDYANKINLKLNGETGISDVLVFSSENSGAPKVLAAPDGTGAVDYAFTPGTFTYTVCPVQRDQQGLTASVDTITDIKITAKQEEVGDADPKTPYYEFGFTYNEDDSPTGRYQAETSSENTATVDCSKLTPGARCYGYVKVDGNNPLKISYLVKNNGVEKPNQAVIYA